VAHCLTGGQAAADQMVVHHDIDLLVDFVDDLGRRGAGCKNANSAWIGVGARSALVCCYI
jgi:hypothetical protein